MSEQKPPSGKSTGLGTLSGRIGKVPRQMGPYLTVRKKRRALFGEAGETLTLNKLNQIISSGQVRAISNSSVGKCGGGDDEAPRSRIVGRIVKNPGRSTGIDFVKPRKRWRIIHPGVAASHWEGNLDAVMAYLGDSNIPWGVVHLGMVDGQAAVAIIHEEGGTWNKSALEADLRRLFFPEAIFPRLEFFCAKVKKGAALGAGSYETAPTCGVGISVRGVSWSAGTVGGYLESENGDTFGLTCHHVALPTRLIRPEYPRDQLEYPEYLNSVGIFHGPFDPKNGDINIAQPACGDNRTTLDIFNARREEFITALKLAQNKSKILGESSPNYKIGLLEAQIKNFSEEIERIVEFDRDFGSLVASSGYAVDEETSHSLDWGLFRLPKTRLCTNRVQADTESSLWERLKIGVRIIFDNVADPVAGESVFKLGRKTGATFGVINTVKDGVYLLENGQTTKEWCVCVEDSLTEFSKEGDSGSFVFNTKFQVIGMITSGCDAPERLTYITPIRLILRDIRKKIGEELFVSGILE
ncbi:hypothetical protein TWF730_003654 [Orbilia blumenaviensis]|uniref:Uncharacterized protein n=1 Tax=Orbilia blumenaviensis TaxID=1796055 RepID=A0AAV9U302_9PEZI